ncbi:MAG: signal recognition particle protein, partial [Pseudomonadota bacterium]|nr:signal recognition particle protein [Pseudomonadota bacterium]
MAKGEFDLNDLSEQLSQMKNLGGMGGIMGMLPGVGKMKKQIAAAGLDDSIFARQQAIISSMTKRERRAPKLMNASRKKRVAAGSGTSVQEVNKLLKMHLQMADMMKKMGRGKGGLMGGMMGKMGGLMGGGMPAGMGGMPDPSKMDPAELERLAKQMGQMGGMPGGLPGGLGGGMPKLPGLGGPGGMPGRLPGLGSKKK